MATTLDTTDYTAPDAELFKTRFPLFSPVDDTLVDMALLESGLRVDECWPLAYYQLGIMYLTAHLLAMTSEPQRSIVADRVADNNAGTIANSGRAGDLKKVTDGDVSTEYYEAESGAVADSVFPEAAKICCQADELGRTNFGRMFKQLRRKARGGARVLSCCPQSGCF